jgi:hypothetical protein
LQQKKYIPLGRWQEFIRERREIAEHFLFADLDPEEKERFVNAAIAELINKLSEER